MSSGPERHEEEAQGGRVLLAIEERHERHGSRSSAPPRPGGPRTRSRGAGRRTRPWPRTRARSRSPPLVARPGEHGAERVTQRHDAGPRDDRVPRDEGEEPREREPRRRRADSDEGLDVEELPHAGPQRRATGACPRSRARCAPRPEPRRKRRSRRRASRSFRRSARTSIAIPSDQSVAKTATGQRLKNQTNLRTKNSRTIRKRPREARNRARLSGVLPRERERKRRLPRRS